MALIWRLFVFVSLPMVLCKSVSEELVLQKLFDDHVNRLGAFGCSKPQPRVIGLAELLASDSGKSENDLLVEKLQPTETVLHRCENTGCCDVNEKCSPKRVEEVPLVFYVSGDDKYMKVMALNHTECACKEIYDPPK